jgi:XTP/dITP diphosphohydrolase
MKTLLFATGNPHKVQEMQQILDGRYRLLSLADIGCMEDIPETADTFEGNALLKARYVVQHYHTDCFAEDTGLEVEALNGAPGVYSARYAGEEKDPAANLQLVLAQMEGVENRKARFRTVIALLLDGREYLFEGSVEGHIAKTPRGEGGFGYDPVFIPEGHSHTFAEMPSEAKHAISHRGKAVAQLLHFLTTKEEKP